MQGNKRSLLSILYIKIKKNKMMTENEKRLIVNQIALTFVAIGGLLTVAYAIYFIFDTLKKWY